METTTRTEQERIALDRQIGELTGVWFGRAAIGDRSYDELMAEAEKKSKRNKRRAGVRGLVAKYGPDSARRIVARHTGRSIQA